MVENRLCVIFVWQTRWRFGDRFSLRRVDRSLIAAEESSRSPKSRSHGGRRGADAGAFVHQGENRSSDGQEDHDRQDCEGVAPRGLGDEAIGQGSEDRGELSGEDEEAEELRMLLLRYQQR